MGSLSSDSKKSWRRQDLLSFGKEYSKPAYFDYNGKNLYPRPTKKLKGHLYLSFPTERKGMQSTERNETIGKFSFLSVRWWVTVGRFPQNYSYPFRPKMDFPAKRFKLLMIHSVPFLPNQVNKMAAKQQRGSDEIFNINVGGKKFTVRKSVLTADPDSKLSNWFKYATSAGGTTNAAKSAAVAQDKAGNMFIDRDGKSFRHIVNYLRLKRDRHLINLALPAKPDALAK
uniref:Potassium channel tetramerisation-type BTB domain-containing protein n=1 Tax=Romanomermis culicivorax TaxID=13658 RepID=A0A915JC85_ROMCU